MVDTGIYLIDVTIRPCAYVKDVVNGSWSNLLAGSKAGNGKVIHGFKVGSLRYFVWAKCQNLCRDAMTTP